MVREGNIFLKLARLHYAHVLAGMFAVIMYFCHFVAILTDMHILKRRREEGARCIFLGEHVYLHEKGTVSSSQSSFLLFIASHEGNYVTKGA